MTEKLRIRNLLQSVSLQLLLYFSARWAIQVSVRICIWRIWLWLLQKSKPIKKFKSLETKLIDLCSQGIMICLFYVYRKQLFRLPTGSIILWRHWQAGLWSTLYSEHSANVLWQYCSLWLLSAWSSVPQLVSPAPPDWSSSLCTVHFYKETSDSSHGMKSWLSCSTVFQFSATCEEERITTIYFKYLMSPVFLRKGGMLQFCHSLTLERYTLLLQKLHYICKIFKHTQKIINVPKLHFLHSKWSFNYIKVNPVL